MWIFAQSVSASGSTGIVGLVVTVLGAFGTAVASVWAWFRKELDDCKKDRKELFDRVDSLHDRVSELSLKIGQLTDNK